MCKFRLSRLPSVFIAHNLLLCIRLDCTESCLFVFVFLFLFFFSLFRFSFWLLASSISLSSSQMHVYCFSVDSVKQWKSAYAYFRENPHTHTQTHRGNLKTIHSNRLMYNITFGWRLIPLDARLTNLNPLNEANLAGALDSFLCKCKSLASRT